MSPEASATPLAALRAQFPVLERIAYLNAGSNGPVPEPAVAAARAELEHELAAGRGARSHYQRHMQLAGDLRSAYAARVGCTPADLALTTSTTDGVARVLLALDLRAGDEIVTSDEEHPGVLGPLVAQRARGVAVRVAPWADIADAASPRTRLVVCSHVGWRSGRFAPLEQLAQLDMPVLLDGAQGAGAVPVDVRALGCDGYAAAGQKWLCGPEGTGLLFVSEALREQMLPPAPGYVNLTDPGAGLDAVPWEDARAYDTPALPAASLAHALASLDLLEEVGWDVINAGAAYLAAHAADALAATGRDVLPRDRTTLVTWREPAAPAAVELLGAAGVVVRSLPGEDLVRASFGGWNTDDDLDRLLTALPR
jgi:selenocysteine lyase/cysteine desulfurase